METHTQSARVQAKAKTRAHENTRQTRRHFNGTVSYSRPFARFRSGIPTGTTPHFKLWMADLNLKRALENVRITDLAARSIDGNLKATYRALADYGVKTVWRLTRLDPAEIHDIKGVGPKRREALRADLAARNVAVRW